MKYLAIPFIFIILTILSCEKETEFKSVKVSGIIKILGASTFMYGTHILKDNNGKILFALRSKKINLDKYIDKNVDIKGHKYIGYPVDNGPEYLEVTKVK